MQVSVITLKKNCKQRNHTHSLTANVKTQFLILL